MLNKNSDFALNKIEKTAIVCQSVVGDHARLTREDFASEDEFAHWKKWSDDDYHEIELAGRSEDDCLSFEGQRDVLTQSAEDVVLRPYIEAERTEARRRIVESIKAILTTKQYRRMCLYYLEGMSEVEIASLEGVNQSSVSRSISNGTKIVERFFEKISRHSA